MTFLNDSKNEWYFIQTGKLHSVSVGRTDGDWGDGTQVHYSACEPGSGSHIRTRLLFLIEITLIIWTKNYTGPQKYCWICINNFNVHASLDNAMYGGCLLHIWKCFALCKACACVFHTNHKVNIPGYLQTQVMLSCHCWSKLSCHIICSSILKMILSVRSAAQSAVLEWLC